MDSDTIVTGLDSDTIVITQTVAGGFNVGKNAVVRGRPGLFFPDDAYRLDQAWSKLATVEDAIFDVSFMGDVEGAIYADASGTKIASLTIPDYEGIKRELEESKTTLSELQNQLVNAMSDIEQLTEELQNVNALESELTTITERVNNFDLLESELTAIADQITTIKETADNALNDVTSLTTEFDNLKTQTDEVASDVQNLSEEQKNYIRWADYSTLDGSVVFTDGYGADVFTLGDALYETVPQSLPPVNP